MKSHKKTVAAIFLILAMVCLCMITAFAADEVPEAVTTEIASFLDEIKDFYDFAASIALPIATVAISWSGLNALLGDSRDMERAATTLKWVVIALAALYLLPSVISYGIKIFEDSGWDPSML